MLAAVLLHFDGCVVLQQVSSDVHVQYISVRNQYP